MTKREFLKSEVLKGLSEKLLPYHFILKKSSSEFLKKTTDGWFSYIPVFLTRDEGWEINPTMGIRINHVEEIYHITSGFEKKYQKGTPTIGISIENFISDRKEHRFILTREDHVDQVIAGLFDLFEEFALSFYEDHSSVEAVDKALNEDPSDTSLTGAIFKGSKGIILARLTKRSNYSDLVNIYTKHYQQLADGFYLADFMRLIEELALAKYA